MFKVGDRVLVKATHVPGTNRPIPVGTVGRIVEMPEEYEDRIAVVEMTGVRGNEWLPGGWSIHVDDLAPVATSLRGRVIKLDRVTVVPFKQASGSMCWACVVVASTDPSRPVGGQNVCLSPDTLMAGEWAA